MNLAGQQKLKVESERVSVDEIVVRG
jgi:hypothetical protein